MWEAAKVLTIIVFLGLCCIQDIREEKLSLKMLIASGILFFMLSFMFEDMTAKERIYNILPGIVASFLAFMTKEQIGYGDAVCLIILGSVVSGEKLLGAVTGGMILFSIIGIIRMIRKKADRKTTMPFLPFLTAGMLWQIVITGAW